MSRRACSFTGCSRPLEGLGYCAGHYRQLRQGRPLAPLTGKALSVMERFEANVDRTSATGCHNWTGVPNSSGYGQIYINKKNVKAHRVAYEIAKGPIPDGMLVDHSCHNRLCVNPDHLRVVDRSGNAQNREGATATTFSGVRGVSWSAPHERWVAGVTIKGVRHSLGHFRDLSAAEYAAVTARARLHEVHSRADLAYLAERGLSVEELKKMEGSHNG